MRMIRITVDGRIILLIYLFCNNYLKILLTIYYKVNTWIKINPIFSC
jgi:hypothetical protein